MMSADNDNGPGPTEAEMNPMLEGWVTLGALAASVPDLRLGLLVGGNTYRHPGVVHLPFAGQAQPIHFSPNLWNGRSQARVRAVGTHSRCHEWRGRVNGCVLRCRSGRVDFINLRRVWRR